MALLRKTMRNVRSIGGSSPEKETTILPPIDLPTQLASGINPKYASPLPSTHDEVAFAMDDYLDSLPFAYSGPSEPAPDPTDA